MATTRAETQVSDWLRNETSANLRMLTRLRIKCERSLEEQPDIDPRTGAQRRNTSGAPMYIPADVNDRGTPSRDWCRAYAKYHTGYQTLLVEERERYKLKLIAHRVGLNEISDAEFDEGLQELAQEALHQLPVAELEAELMRRRQAVAALAEGDPDAAEVIR